jgi:hypothetical protein
VVCLGLALDLFKADLWLFQVLFRFYLGFVYGFFRRGLGFV